jgi:hypothetical protein
MLTAKTVRGGLCDVVEPDDTSRNGVYGAK